MRAVEITQPGGPEVLKIGTRPYRRPKVGEVLIKVAAAGVTGPIPCSAPATIRCRPRARHSGLELAGGIVALGEGVRDWRVGDTATALVAGRRLRRVLHRARSAMPADPKGMDAGRGRGASGNLLHRVEQRLRPRRG